MSNDSPGAIPAALVSGVPMLKISSKKIKQVIIRLDGGSISWASRNESKGNVSHLPPC